MTVVGWEPDAHIDQKARWQVGRAKRSGDIFFPGISMHYFKNVFISEYSSKTA